MEKAQKLYQHRETILRLDSSQILSTFEELELKNRCGGMSYLAADEVAQVTAKHMRENWSREDLELFKEISKRLSEGKPLGAVLFQKALREFFDIKLKEKIGQATADSMVPSNLAKVTKSLGMRLAANMALSASLGVSPDPKLPREHIVFAGNSIRWQVSQKAVRLVVERSAVNNFDFHVFFLYDETIERGWLVGHADKKTMLACEVATLMGRDCHCLAFKKMLPLSMMMESLKIKSLPTGMLMEQVPNPFEIPITTSLTIPEPTAHDPGDDFYKTIEGPKRGMPIEHK